MYLPTFDVSSKCTNIAWVQKLHTYFHLSKMKEVEAIKMAILHLEGEAHNWWFHKMSTLGHATVTSCDNLTQRIVKHFHRRDSKSHFRELTQLKQTENP